MPRNSLPVPRCKSYRKIYIEAASAVAKNRSSLREQQEPIIYTTLYYKGILNQMVKNQKLMAKLY